jgi:predicted MFS family arabinose efflux permease
MEQHKLIPFTPYQKVIIAIIALIQFTVVLDFMVMSPLGDLLMKRLEITPKQFGVVVASYAFSAGISGILSAGFADRFDRKKFLLFFFAGFVLGTLFCGLANTYELLVAARIITGLFGGVIGAISMAIITDLFEVNQRGRVMGFTQMGFAASQVLGIPISLFVAYRSDWNVPFLMIVAFALLLGALIVVKMKPVTKHLALQSGESGNAMPHLVNTLKTKRYQTGYIATALLSMGGFMMMPFGTAFAINNLGVPEGNTLLLVFAITGIASLIMMPLIGKLSDKYSKLKIFTIASLWAIVIVVIHTHFGLIPLWLVITSNILMFSGIMGRMVPSTTLVSMIPQPKDRGAFMSINSSLQQMAGGIGAIIAGLIIVQAEPPAPLADGTIPLNPIYNFDIVGYVVAFFILVSIYCIYRVDRMVQGPVAKPQPNPSTQASKPAEPVAAE